MSLSQIKEILIVLFSISFFQANGQNLLTSDGQNHSNLTVTDSPGFYVQVMNFPDTILVRLDFPDHLQFVSITQGDSVFISDKAETFWISAKNSRSQKFAIASDRKKRERYRFTPKFISRPDAAEANLWDEAIAGGNLVISTEPDAVLFLDGKKIFTGSGSIFLRPGRYEIKAERGENFFKETSIEIEETGLVETSLFLRQTAFATLAKAIIPGMEQLGFGNRPGFLNRFGIWSSALLLTLAQSEMNYRENSELYKVQTGVGLAALTLIYGYTYYSIFNQPETDFKTTTQTQLEKGLFHTGKIKSWQFVINGDPK
ncbi:MAG: hypothetical protein J0L62_06880 [Bacteroidetes bacterium]|nr:hypothetical protein [Bacteroidota bacterium]